MFQIVFGSSLFLLLNAYTTWLLIWFSINLFSDHQTFFAASKLLPQKCRRACASFSLRRKGVRTLTNTPTHQSYLILPDVPIMFDIMKSLKVCSFKYRKCHVNLSSKGSISQRCRWLECN